MCVLFRLGRANSVILSEDDENGVDVSLKLNAACIAARTGGPECHFEEMITLFQVNGAMIYVDPDGKMPGYDDVFTRIDKCRKHYAANGLGEAHIDQFIR